MPRPLYIAEYIARAGILDGTNETEPSSIEINLNLVLRPKFNMDHTKNRRGGVGVVSILFSVKFHPFTCTPSHSHRDKKHYRHRSRLSVSTTD